MTVFYDESLERPKKSREIVKVYKATKKCYIHNSKAKNKLSVTNVEVLDSDLECSNFKYRFVFIKKKCLKLLSGEVIYL